LSATVAGEKAGFVFRPNNLLAEFCHPRAIALINGFPVSPQFFRRLGDVPFALADDLNYFRLTWGKGPRFSGGSLPALNESFLASEIFNELS
jgi:hypothetical protein